MYRFCPWDLFASYVFDVMCMNVRKQAGWVLQHIHTINTIFAKTIVWQYLAFAFLIVSEIRRFYVPDCIH